MKGSGFPKGETLVSPFGGASLVLSPAGGRKYEKSKYQTDRQIQI
jgi:hypothetical protein